MTFIGNPCDNSKLVYIDTPWKRQGTPIRVAVNRAVVPRFKLACKRAARLQWKPKRIDSFNCRQIRGSAAWSRHAYGAAWDFFSTGPTTPPPGGVWKPDDTFGEKFALCFEDLGFTWGGRWGTRVDFPHIEWRTNTVPKLTTKERYRTWKKYRSRGVPG